MLTNLLTVVAAQETRDFQGIPIEIEWPKGSTRTGTNSNGEHWSREMQADYGFVPNTVAVGDKEDLDVYIGPNANAPKAYVIKQLKEDGTLDEIKVMLGFEDEDEAKQCYLKHYPDGWESRVGSIRELPVSYLKEMVEDHRDGREPRTKAASSVPTLVVTDPVSGQTFAFADFLKNGPNATPLFGIESRPLRLSELRGMD